MAYHSYAWRKSYWRKFILDIVFKIKIWISSLKPHLHQILDMWLEEWQETYKRYVGCIKELNQRPKFQFVSNLFRTQQLNKAHGFKNYYFGTFSVLDTG